MKNGTVGLAGLGALVLSLSILHCSKSDTPAATAPELFTKVVGTGGVGSSYQGFSVSLSADGNTALAGGFGDNSNAGAAWLWTRTAGVWSESSKLIAPGATGAAYQGSSVALSTDGGTALIGGYGDNSNAGAFWVYAP